MDCDPEHISERGAAGAVLSDAKDQNLSCRPSILSEVEFKLVVATAAKLHQKFPDDDVGWMVTCQPVLLVEDIDYILQELGRWAARIPSHIYLVICT